MESFEGFVRRTEELLVRVDELEEGIREDVYELLDAVDILHRRALRHLIAHMDQSSLERVRDVPEVGWLFDAYGFDDDEGRPGAVQVTISKKERGREGPTPNRHP